jgi:SHS family lactate transporter-like MFS transporter
MTAKLTRDQRNTLLAAVLAWSMDTFDYFMLVLVLSDIAHDKGFGATRLEVSFLTTVTLAMRPFGALTFGIWADRVGRRGPLIANVLLYSAAGILCAIAPNITVLLILRAIFGFGMGGEWGLGTALALEKLPVERRGFYSGLLQMGYPLGYLFAAVAYLMLNAVGLGDHNADYGNWRWIFVLSFIPALVTLLLRRRVAESQAWRATRQKMKVTRTSMRDILRDQAVLRRFGYLIVLMTALNWMAHSAQDDYPFFLKLRTNGGAGLSPTEVGGVTVCFCLAAIGGTVAFGALSERIGRRPAIVLGATLALFSLPLFTASYHGVVLLIVSSAVMMFLVEGVWGVIPAHLTEMSPDAIRGFYPGVTYQIGNLLASLNIPIQDGLTPPHSYQFTLGVTLGPALVVVIITTAIGKERKGKVFGGDEGPPPRLGHPGMTGACGGTEDNCT